MSESRQALYQCVVGQSSLKGLGANLPCGENAPNFLACSISKFVGLRPLLKAQSVKPSLGFEHLVKDQSKTREVLNMFDSSVERAGHSNFGAKDRSLC